MSPWSGENVSFCGQRKLLWTKKLPAVDKKRYLLWTKNVTCCGHPHIQHERAGELWALTSTKKATKGRRQIYICNCLLDKKKREYIRQGKIWTYERNWVLVRICERIIAVFRPRVDIKASCMFGSLISRELTQDWDVAPFQGGRRQLEKKTKGLDPGLKFNPCQFIIFFHKHF